VHRIVTGTLLKDDSEIEATGKGIPGAAARTKFLTRILTVALLGQFFGNPLRIAREQKSISLATRAEATYAEYREQKASASGGRGFRLPLL
jgi:hypothetical protein